jgi:Rrf2 family protein
VHVTARADYAIRALVELAATPQGSATRQQLAEQQEIPAKFLEGILTDLRRAGLVSAQRGSRGGYQLAAPANTIALADIIRAVEGPLAAVRGEPPENTTYAGPAKALTEVWVALRSSMREVLEHTTVADVVSGNLPQNVRALLDQPEAWTRR